LSTLPFHRRALLTRFGRAKPPGADYWIRVHRRAMACRFEIVWPDDGSARHLAFGACAGVAWKEDP